MHAFTAPASSTVGDVLTSALAGFGQAAASAANVGYMLADPNGYAHRIVDSMLNNRMFETNPTPLPSEQFANGPANYQPQTTPGRYAKSITSNATNALITPGGLLTKAASVVLPGLGSQGGHDIAAAMGAGPLGQSVGATVGGVLGGGIAGMMGAPKASQILNPVDASAGKAVTAALGVDNSTPAMVQSGLDRGVLPLATTPGMAQLGETVTTLPGPGQVAIRNAVGERNGTQTGRAMGAMQDILGVDPENARGSIDSMVAAGQAKAAPIYDAIRSDPSPVWNTDLATLAQRPAIKKAIGVVTNDMLNAGQNPKAAGFQLDPDTGWQIPPSTPGGLDNIEQQPTAATWDAVYKAMGRTVERNEITGQPKPDSISAGNRGITTATADLRSALAGDPANGVQGAIPNYGQALSVSGDYLSTANAFNRAKGKLLNGTVYDFNKLWDSAKTPAEQDAIRSAAANDVLEASDRGKVEPGLFRTPAVKQKLGVMFGDKADPFISQMENDLAERNIYSKITGGSPTASRQALIDQAKKQNAPSGMGGLVSKGLGAAEWVQSAMHPALLMTKLAHAGVNAAGGAGKTAALPWENPDVSARLGQLLSDPTEMRGLLGSMDAQSAANAIAAKTAGRGLLSLPAMSASTTIGGLLGPSQAQATSARRSSR